MTLSQMAIRNAKPREKKYKLFDGGGMYLLIEPDGKQYWRLDYRHGGKRRTLALGVYPEVSLKQAREKRAEARAQLEEGHDPVHLRKIAKLTRSETSANTFRAVAGELILKMQREGRAAITIDKTQWMLEFAYPYIGDRPISEISAAEVLTALRSVEARGRYDTARRLRSKCGQVFRLAIATGRAERDPTQDLRGALNAVSYRTPKDDREGLTSLSDCIKAGAEELELLSRHAIASTEAASNEPNAATERTIALKKFAIKEIFELIDKPEKRAPNKETAVLASILLKKEVSPNDVTQIRKAERRRYYHS
ncbi:MAG: Arm DNA-binding domain-containing protein [Pseudomonadota bacterium]